MAQRGRKSSSSRNRPVEDSGGNAFFTMGLVTVIALLIVGYVMTQGGIQSLADRSSELITVPMGEDNQTPPGGSQAQQPAAQPTATPSLQAIAPTQQPTPSALDNQQVEEVKRYYQNQLEQKEEAFEQQLEKIRQKHQDELREIRLKLKMLEMENERLKGDN